MSVIQQAINGIRELDNESFNGLERLAYYKSLKILESLLPAAKKEAQETFDAGFHTALFNGNPKNPADVKDTFINSLYENK